jgi:hypothetical protein
MFNNLAQHSFPNSIHSRNSIRNYACPFR